MSFLADDGHAWRKRRWSEADVARRLGRRSYQMRVTLADIRETPYWISDAPGLKRSAHQAQRPPGDRRGEHACGLCQIQRAGTPLVSGPGRRTVAAGLAQRPVPGSVGGQALSNFHNSCISGASLRICFGFWTTERCGASLIEDEDRRAMIAINRS